MERATLDSGAHAGVTMLFISKVDAAPCPGASTKAGRRPGFFFLDSNRS